MIDQDTLPGELPRHPTKVSESVRKLGQALGESQQAFAHRMNTAVRTIARWETVRPPHFASLVALAKAAENAGLHELKVFFRTAALDDLGEDLAAVRHRL